jgi:hypothetical protein
MKRYCSLLPTVPMYVNRDGPSAGFTRDGIHPGMSDMPLDSNSALILRNINNNSGLLLRPFHTL